MLNHGLSRRYVPRNDVFQRPPRSKKCHAAADHQCCELWYDLASARLNEFRLMCSIKLCSRCQLRLDLCLCSRAPALSLRSQKLKLILVTHPDEPRKPSNTGRLLEAALSQCDLWLWQRVEFESQWQQFLSTQSRTPVLLFPDDELVDGTRADDPHMASAQVNHSTSAVLDKTPAPDIDSCVYILLDATWQQAKKILRKAPSLQACQRLSLSSLKQSRYSLRKNQQPGSFSSVESGVSLLRELGLEDDAVAIEAYFDRFLLHSEANRSGYALDDNS